MTLIRLLGLSLLLVSCEGQVNAPPTDSGEAEFTDGGCPACAVDAGCVGCTVDSGCEGCAPQTPGAPGVVRFEVIAERTMVVDALARWDAPTLGQVARYAYRGGENTGSPAWAQQGEVQAADVLLADVPRGGSFWLCVRAVSPSGAASADEACNSFSTPQRSTADAGSLLPGATPSNFTVPQGWKAYRTQDFEGSLGANEYVRGSLTTTRPHTGSKSLQGTYAGDGFSVRWWLDYPLDLPREVYMSFWDHMGSNGLMNDELWLWQAVKREPFFQEVFLTYWWDSQYGLNSTKGQRLIVSQGKRGKAWWETAQNVEIDWGKWTQWEIHYRANTPGQSDGLIKVYRNGVQVTSLTNVDLNGAMDMTGMRVLVGGVYTKLIWRDKVNGACETQAPFTGACRLTQGVCGYQRYPDFSQAGPDLCVPPQPRPPIFDRFIDDVIVLVPANG